MTRALLIAVGVLAAFPAAAEPRFILRMATVAPDGTAWARELRALGRDIEKSTEGDVRIKWYFGGMVGDELAALDRIRLGQMDGSASGGVLCQAVVPSMRVLWLPGLFQSREEAAFITRQLNGTFEAEAQHNGIRLLATSGVGPVVIFSRTPVRSLADLRALKLWLWDVGSVAEIGLTFAREMGLHIVTTPINEASRAYEDGRVDAFLSVPTAALAFQWSTQARYVTDLRTGYLSACIVLSNRTFDRLPLGRQQNVAEAIAKYDQRFEDLGRRQDDALLGGLFEKQGLKPVPVSESFRTEFFETARIGRDRMGEKLVPRPLLEKVMKLLGDYRAEHGQTRR